MTKLGDTELVMRKTQVSVVKNIRAVRNSYNPGYVIALLLSRSSGVKCNHFSSNPENGKIKNRSV